MTAPKAIDILLSIMLIWQIILQTAKALPLDGGYGGVYNSPEANAYWARRFGAGFLDLSPSRNLNQKIRNVNRVSISKPSFGLEESFRSDTKNVIQGSQSDTKAKIKVYKTKIESKLEKNGNKPEEQNTINPPKISKNEKSSKTIKSSNRAIKINDSNAQTLKKKYLKRYFSRKN